MRVASLALMVAAGSAWAQPGTYNASVSKDAWVYPPVGSGVSQAAPLFGSPLGVEADPDRLGFLLLMFDLGPQLDLGQGPYRVDAVTVTVRLLNSSTFSTTNGMLYDPTHDTRETYLGIIPDADPGRPIELFGAVFNNGLSASSWNEFTTPVFENGLYNAEPVEIDAMTGQPRSVLSNIDDGFDALPWAVATTPDTYTGSGGTTRVADGATLTFQLDLSDPAMAAFLAEEINTAGTLSVVVTSLHAASFGGIGGNDIWPRLGTRESFGLPDPSISVTLSTGALACSPADLTTTGATNGLPDGQINGSDFTYFLSLFAVGCP